MRSAVIIETRFNPDLPKIIRGHLKYLTGDWRLIFFGSYANHKQITTTFPDVLFFDIEYKEITFNQYNILLKNYDFWLKIPDEEILIFQYDSMLLKKGIEKFFDWDYVGSPWIKPLWGGNGGLSIRKKSIMLACIKSNRSRYNNEDGYFCDIMRSSKIGKLAPREVCSEFSCETIFRLGTYGYHKAKGYLKPKQFEQIIQQYKII